MDPARSALCGALAALAVCAAPAYARSGPVTAPGAVTLTPVTGTPGARVQLRVAGCPADKATAASEAFVTDARLAKDAAGLFAETTVRSTAAPGTYAVRVRCDGGAGTAEGRLTVTAHGDARPAEHPSRFVHRPPAPSPVAPVPAGGGGTAAAADPPGVPGLVLAGGTALAAAGATWYRRRTDTGRR
ncbi:hypothetical protein ACH4UT_13605 [Streptomyces sp. NPDC020799]|uniref:hypothetical protein n=1 Tax=Streptomyces sp. NPDC020799 TaxID=3365091 RepID=UPI0037933139